MIKRNIVASIFILTLALFVFGITPGYSEEVRGVTSDTINIGLIADMTGPVTAVTVPMANGVKNYFRYINEQGGIYGRKIRVFHEDDRYSVPNTFAAFKKIVYKDKILAAILITQTAGIAALMPHYQKEKLPIISVSTARVMTEPVKRYIFTVKDTYENGAKVGVDYIMKDMKAKNPIIGIVRLDNDSGKMGANGVKEAAKHYGFKYHEEAIPAGAIDSTSQVLNMKRAEADYVVMPGSDGTAITFLRDARKLGYKPKIFIGTLFSNSEFIVKTVGKGAENFICENPFVSWGDKSPGMKKMMEITERYAPGKEQPVDYTLGWVKGMVFAEGMKRAGKSLNSESLVEGIEGMKNFDTGGLTGLITYGPDDHKGGDFTRFLKADVEKGTLIPITEWRKPGF
jgi:ABC-type branched-subunit amino acid transport system substrate-binding protein